jgi:hypothetical protein
MYPVFLSYFQKQQEASVTNSPNIQEGNLIIKRSIVPPFKLLWVCEGKLCFIAAYADMCKHLSKRHREDSIEGHQMRHFVISSSACNPLMCPCLLMHQIIKQSFKGHHGIVVIVTLTILLATSNSLGRAHRYLTHKNQLKKCLGSLYP